MSDVALSGEKAIEMIKHRISQAKFSGTPMYKLIFCDYSMPEMDGVQVAIELKKLMAEEGL